MTEEISPDARTPHGGDHVLEIAKAHGVTHMFTLSGAHVFPMYDAAVKADEPMPIIDVRHEQTATFAAEAIGKLTRTPGLAVLTAGPGVTNGASAIAQAFYSGAPMVVVGGRAPAATWGSGTLQEVDHPPIFKSISKHAVTAHTFDSISTVLDEAFTLAGAAHRGPSFVDIPMDEFFLDGPITHQSTGIDTSVREPDSEGFGEATHLMTPASSLAA